MAALTYCHAPAHSCSRLIPCEDRALTIRGFPRPAPCREGCKVFWEYRFCSPGRHSETSAILWIQNAISSHQKNIFIKENLCIPWILCEKKLISVRTGIFHTEFTEFTETFLYRRINKPHMEQMESTELVADFVATAGAMGNGNYWR